MFAPPGHKMDNMMRCSMGLIGLLMPCAAFAQGAPPPSAMSLHATYETFAAGVHVAEAEAGFSFGPWTYQMNLGYHTTGVVGILFRGHEFDHVNGSWHGERAVPTQYEAGGSWRGNDRHAAIDYQHGLPVVRVLIPPDESEREPVPESLRKNTIDTLSALAELIHAVADTGRCETTVHTYDGRRAVEIQARTVGEEILEPTGRSSFAGKAIRCDFSGRLLAGFKFGSEREHDSKPLHGSAWLAPVTPGGPLLPVRMSFETRWFGDAVMYLTETGPGAELTAAVGP